MAGMKITPNSAMRARDVSRPRAGQLAAAAEREDEVTRHGEIRPVTGKPDPAEPAAAEPVAGAPAPGAPVTGEPVTGALAPGEPAAARRRRRREP